MAQEAQTFALRPLQKSLLFSKQEHPGGAWCREGTWQGACSGNA